MPASRERSGLRSMLTAVGAGLLIVLSCTGPLLVAGGASVAVGGARGSPLLIILGAVMVLVAVVVVVRALRRRTGAALVPGRRTYCCPSVPAPSHDQDASGPRRLPNG